MPLQVQCTIMSTGADKRICSGLHAETVETPSRPLQSVHDIKSGNGLPFSVLGVSHRVADDVLKEDLEHTASLLVDQARNTLDTSSPCKTADRRLRDALDVVAKNLAMALGSTLAESFSTFSAASHCE